MKSSVKKESFEKRMERLDAIVTALEDTALPLDKGMALYKEGMELSRACREQLEHARNEIRVYTDKGLRPFDPDAGPEAAEDAFQPEEEE